jgi:hypothetical protein
MKILWNRDTGRAVCEGEELRITCDVRNELNGRRRLHEAEEVIRAVVRGEWGPPYMPRQFPKGTWKITALEKTDNPEFAPVKIKTNARQIVEVWKLDKKGGYDRKSRNTIEDEGYHLHWSKPFKTTLGCGRVGYDTPQQVQLLAGLIQKAWDRDEPVVLVVT